MKRALALILLFAFCLTLCGCAKHPDGQAVSTVEATSPGDLPDGTEFVSPTETAAPTENGSFLPADDKFYVVDLQSSFNRGNNVQLIETDNTLYYCCNEQPDNGPPAMIYFSDKEYKDWMPLCGKPNCNHKINKSDGDSVLSCNAIFEGNVVGIWLYGNHIYYCFMLSKYVDCSDYVPQLWRMKLDGTDHEFVAKIDIRSDEEKLLSSGSWAGCFFNKYLVFEFVGAMTDSDGTDIEVTKVKKTGIVDLDDPDHFEELSFLLDGERTIGIPYIYFAVGETLYGVEKVGTPDIIRCDLKTRTAVTLCTLPFSPVFQGSGIHDGKIYFCDSYRSGTVVAVDMETGEMETVLQAEPATEIWMQPHGDYIFGTGTVLNDFPNCTRVYDYSGKLIHEIPYSDYDDRCLLFSYAIGDYVFAHEYFDGTETSYTTPEWYLLVSEVGTENFRWHRWAPED